jgi:hypothetical protein
MDEDKQRRIERCARLAGTPRRRSSLSGEDDKDILGTP